MTGSNGGLLPESSRPPENYSPGLLCVLCGFSWRTLRSKAFHRKVHEEPPQSSLRKPHGRERLEAATCNAGLVAVVRGARRLFPGPALRPLRIFLADFAFKSFLPQSPGRTPAKFAKKIVRQRELQAVLAIRVPVAVVRGPARRKIIPRACFASFADFLGGLCVQKLFTAKPAKNPRKVR
jgi:hypothetical protein